MRDRRWEGRGDGLLVALGAWLALRLARPLSLLGVDGRACAEIVRTRLRLDQRGPPGLALGTASLSARSGDVLGIGLVLMLYLFWLMGLGIGVAALLGVPGPMFVALVSGATLGLFSLQLVLFYGTLLLDPTDIGVLHSRPVSGRTLFAARLLHVATYLLCGSVALCFFPAVLGCLAFPPLAVLVAVPLAVTGSALLALGLVALAYATLLRLVGPTRFQRATLWVQIAAGTFLMGGVQLVVPVVRHSGLAAAVAERPELLAGLPPFHHAALFKVLAGAG
ncbi:MAG: hypothetical protein FJ296_03270, partial [Planctomycetes bacterium]|nr:hypothetical protein [Planctomycetota bacterium]